MAEVTKLIRQRGNAKATLTKTVTAVEALFETTPLPVAQIKAKLESLEEAKLRFNEAQDELELVCDEADIDGHVEERSDFNDKFFALKDNILSTVTPTEQTAPAVRPLQGSNCHGSTCLHSKASIQSG